MTWALGNIRATSQYRDAREQLQEMLEGYGFFRTYQSYLVPVDRIRQLQSSKFGSSYEAYLDDGTVVPVSCGKYAKLKEFIMQRSLRL